MNGILKFLVTFVFFIGIIIVVIFFCIKKNYIVKTAQDLFRESTKKIINWAIRIVAAALGILVLICFIIPLSIDIPSLISGNYKTTNGVITSYYPESGYKRYSAFYSQEITLDNSEQFSFYLGPNVEEGDAVTVVYLPNSRFVLEIIE